MVKTRQARLRGLLLATVMAAIPAAASAAPWFGQKPPPTAANDPTKEMIATTSADLPEQPARFAPGPRSPVFEGKRMLADVKTAVGFALESRASGDVVWGRVSGTPAYDHAIAWMESELKAAGLKDAHLESFPTFVSLPTSSKLTLIADPAWADGSQNLVLTSAIPGGRGPVNGDLTAPMIYVGHGTHADLAGRDLHGKIAVMHDTPNPGLFSADEVGRAGELIKAGAAGVIQILDQIGNVQSYDTDRAGCGTGLCFTLGGGDGYFLENMLGKAADAGKTVSAHLQATGETKHTTAANAVATIPGKTKRTILINAHADSWFAGADDNGTGMATALALARYFAKGPQPTHTIVFLISAGHHSAAAGIPEFRLKHEHDYVDAADLIINLEHVAATGMVREQSVTQDDNFGRPMIATSTELPMSVAVNDRSPFVMGLWRKGVDCFGLSVQRVVDSVLPGEPGGFNAHPGGLNPERAPLFKDLPKRDDIPITHMMSLGPLYHTSGEVVDTIPAAGLERAGRFFAYMIQSADKASPEMVRKGPFKGGAACPATP